jgi:hypothetical protein
LQSFPFEVKPGTDIFDDFGTGELFPHSFDLPVKVVSLLG